MTNSLINYFFHLNRNFILKFILEKSLKSFSGFRYFSPVESIFFLIFLHSEVLYKGKYGKIIPPSIATIGQIANKQ